MKKQNNVQELKIDFEKFKRNLKEKAKLNLDLLNSKEEISFKSKEEKKEELNNKELENNEKYESMIEKLEKTINEKNNIIEKLENELKNKKIEISQNKIKEY